MRFGKMTSQTDLDERESAGDHDDPAHLPVARRRPHQGPVLRVALEKKRRGCVYILMFGNSGSYFFKMYNNFILKLLLTLLLSV